MLIRFKEAFLGLVFPVHCETCGKKMPTEKTGFPCDDCASKISWINGPHCRICGRTIQSEGCLRCKNDKPHYNRAYACAFYDGIMKDLLHAYKFKQRKILKRFLSKSMETFVRNHLGSKKFDAVLSVPLDKEKKWARGFNQSKLLSSHLADSLGLPEISDVLSRKKSRSAQALLAKNQRRKNIEGRFYSKAKLGGKRNLLLIDDILTTGLTASECSKTLKEMGAEDVTVLVCARGL